jgi:hypothetical protein
MVAVLAELWGREEMLAVPAVLRWRWEMVAALAGL